MQRVCRDLSRSSRVSLTISSLLLPLSVLARLGQHVDDRSESHTIDPPQQSNSSATVVQILIANHPVSPWYLVTPARLARASIPATVSIHRLAFYRAVIKDMAG
ncbi:hypothetical protein M6B38_173570 [Iris pallida]|uniref:Uncharacterized protein n=1 Tax=Iris pallida TaxID=29817 RepID=A0AAX6ESG0_IRIPA|nr:hypothetical protein M6B38_173570 [Iris pallida]